MAIGWQGTLAVTAAAVIVAVPVGFTSHRNTHIRNLRVVEEGVLYRSGQLSPAGLERVVLEKGIRSVVSLRSAGRKSETDPDAWEEDFCAARHMGYFRIVPRSWWENDQGEVPAKEMVKEFLDVMDEPKNYPVLVHCFAGIHRTGTMCAVFRMEYQRWPVDRAMEEMHHCGFRRTDLKPDIEGYLRTYRPRGGQRVAAPPPPP